MNNTIKKIGRNLIELYKKGNIHKIHNILGYNEIPTNKINYKKITEYLCSHGDFDVLKYIIDYYKIVNEDIINNIFRRSCERGHVNVLLYLIEYSNKHNRIIDLMYGGYYFNKICNYGQLDIIKYIIKYSEIHNIELIHDNITDIFNNACLKNHIQLVYYLLNYSEKINKRINIQVLYYDILKYICYNDYIYLLRYILYLIKHNYGYNITSFKKIKLNIRLAVRVYKSLFIQKRGCNIKRYNRYIENNIIVNKLIYINTYATNYIMYII